MSDQWYTRVQVGLENLQIGQRSPRLPADEHNLTMTHDRAVEQRLSLKRKSEIFDLAFCMLEYTEDLKLSEGVLSGLPVRELKYHALNALIWMKVR
jgi:hypothetical protein